MKKLTPQKKINIIAGISIAVLGLFWFILYLPSRQKIRDLNEELHFVQSQINQIEGDVNVSGKLEEGILILNERYRQLESKFPEKEEEALAMLSVLAKRHKVTLRSVKSQPKDFFVHKDAGKIKINGKMCQMFMVSTEIKANYKDLVAYLDAIKELLPAYVTVDNFNIQKDSSGSLILNIQMDLILYLLA